MKTNYFLAVLFSMAMLNMNAQFTDNFEICSNDGDPISGGHWTDWGCGGGVGCAILCSSAQAHSGTYSGLIPDDGTTDAVLDLGNKIFGLWGISFWMYVPSNREAYWNLQGTVPIGAGEWIIGNVFFNQDNANPGIGLADNTALGPVNFNFPHDAWFEIVMIWDISSGISLATWEWYVDGVEVLPTGTPFTDGAATVPTSLGGFDFFSISTDNLYYLDDIVYMEPLIGFDDFSTKYFDIYPNPVKDQLNIEAQEIINSVSISNVLGQELYKSNVDALDTSIDMSGYAKGTYFVKVQIGDDSITKKFIKD